MQDLTNEAGDRHGCHTCDAKTPGTKAQPGRPRGGVVTRINWGNHDFPIKP